MCATSASNLTALAVFMFAKCFCGEKESGINQRITNVCIIETFMRMNGVTLTPGLGSDK